MLSFLTKFLHRLKHIIYDTLCNLASKVFMECVLVQLVIDIPGLLSCYLIGHFIFLDFV